jgi:hypothetical protein
MPESILNTSHDAPPVPSLDEPAPAEDNAAQSNAYVIEVRGQTAGIVARDGQGFRFHASAHRFNPLDGRRFANPREAERAALRLIDPATRRRAAMPPRRFAWALS